MKMELINGKWYAVERWAIEDVLSHDNGSNNLTEDECADVLEFCCDYHDCNNGMTWDLIQNGIDHIVELRRAEDLVMFTHEASFEFKVRDLKTYEKEIAFTITRQTPKDVDAWEYLKTREFKVRDLKTYLVIEINRIDAERAKQ